METATNLMQCIDVAGLSSERRARRIERHQHLLGFGDEDVGELEIELRVTRGEQPPGLR